MNGVTDKNEKDKLINLQNRQILELIQHGDDTQDDYPDKILRLKEELECLPCTPAMVDILKEIKQQTLNTHMPSFDNDPQMNRLDNMLLAEGITGPEKHALFPNVGETQSEQIEFQEKLSVFRQIFQEETELCEKSCKEFKDHVLQLLDCQSRLRPVSDLEKELLLAHIQHKFQAIQMQLKESMCQAVMLLKNRFFDARRKRRNFSKAATEILNDYFYNNLANPYPSDDVKEQLAAKCNISVAQVSNWFGNKRIRYKKSLGKQDSIPEYPLNNKSPTIQGTYSNEEQSIPNLQSTVDHQ